MASFSFCLEKRERGISLPHGKVNTIFKDRPNSRQACFIAAAMLLA
jgi:hypothetical protein